MPMKFSFFIPVKSSFLKIESESFNPSNSVSRADLSSSTGIHIHPPQMGLEPTIPVYTSFLKVELDSFDPSTSVLCAQLFSSVCTSLLKANWIAEDGFDS